MFEDQRAGTHLAVNPQVLHEVIDGEVIVIDLATGNYYSLRGSAADLWQLLRDTGRATPDELVHGLQTQYDGGIGEHEAAVSRFLAQLEEEGLVTTVEPPDDAAAGVIVADRNGRSTQPFEPPQLEKHTDMQDLVLLDPVHEVDQSGWPRLPGAAPRGSAV